MHIQLHIPNLPFWFLIEFPGIVERPAVVSVNVEANKQKSSPLGVYVILDFKYADRLIGSLLILILIQIQIPIFRLQCNVANNQIWFGGPGFEPQQPANWYVCVVFQRFPLQFCPLFYAQGREKPRWHFSINWKCQWRRPGDATKLPQIAIHIVL